MRINKAFSICLIALMVSGVLSACVVNAESAIPKPSVPEFTAKYADASYDEPSTSTSATDAYTGKEVLTTQPEYHVQIKYIEVTIKNQPFTPTKYGSPAVYVLGLGEIVIIALLVVVAVVLGLVVVYLRRSVK